MKYRSDYPKRFGAPEGAGTHGINFFDWYNHNHHHSALEMLAPADIPHGLAERRVADKQQMLDAAYSTHPECFPRGASKARTPQGEVWIHKTTQPGTVDEDETPTDSPDWPLWAQQEMSPTADCRNTSRPFVMVEPQ